MNLLKRFSQQIRMLNDGFCWLFQACAQYFLITFTTIALSGPRPSSLAFLLFPYSLPSASLILCMWTIPFHQAVYDSMHPFPSGCTTEENASPSPSVSVYKTSGSMGGSINPSLFPSQMLWSDLTEAIMAAVNSSLQRPCHDWCQCSTPLFPLPLVLMLFFWPWFCDVPCTVGMEI